MEDEKIKKQIGTNIGFYRKQHGLTQAGLAEKLNYSDKAISKWERGESVPDVLTLMQLAELFGIRVDDLLWDPNAAPACLTAAHSAGELKQEQKPKADRRVICGLTTVLVWFVALLVFVILSFVRVPHSWICFAYAVPANAIVSLSLRSAWRDYSRNNMLISCIMWGTLTSVYLSLLVFGGWNVWTMFLLGIPGQIAIILWFRLYRKAK